ncbi:MAG: aldo/keto reductase family protein [Gammaproteobacteria bacterium]
MQYRTLGNSDLRVSELALGSWLTYGVGVNADITKRCFRAAFDVGINFFDTANSYGQGAAETALGSLLADYSRESYVLATKLYFPMSERDSGLSAEQVHKQIDGSLNRLNVDYVDLYQCHRYDEDTPLEETLAALTEVVQAGKARYIGFSEWTPAQIRAALALTNTTSFVSSQPQYSMIWREPEREVMPLCASNGIGQIVWSPLAQGVLTGKYLPGQSLPTDSRAADDRMNQFMQNASDQRLLEAVQQLLPIAQGLGLTMAQLALAWVLRKDNVAAAIIGASRPEQVHDNAAASGVTLDASTLSDIDAVFASV